MDGEMGWKGVWRGGVGGGDGMLLLIAFIYSSVLTLEQTDCVLVECGFK